MSETLPLAAEDGALLYLPQGAVARAQYIDKLAQTDPTDDAKLTLVVGGVAYNTTWGALKAANLDAVPEVALGAIAGDVQAVQVARQQVEANAEAAAKSEQIALDAAGLARDDRVAADGSATKALTAAQISTNVRGIVEGVRDEVSANLSSTVQARDQTIAARDDVNVGLASKATKAELLSTTGLATTALGAFNPATLLELVGDGSDESAKLQYMLQNGRLVYAATAGRTITVKDIVIPGNRRLDARGAIFKSAPGARWMFKLTGYQSRLNNCSVDDAGKHLVRVSSLAGAASAGGTDLTLASPSGFEAQMTIAIPIVGQPRHLSRIASISNGVIQLDRPLPGPAVAGTEVRASFGAIWAATGAERWQITDVNMTNCEAQIVMKPDLPAQTGPTRGKIADIRGDGGFISNLEIWPNCSETNYYNIRGFGGRPVTHTYTGDGTTTDFAIPTGPVFDTIDLRVRVAGADIPAAQYTFINGGMGVKLTPPRPAATSIQLIHTVYGARGLYMDGLDSTTTSGGHHMLDLSFLQHERNIHIEAGTIIDAKMLYGDGGSFENVYINGIGYSTIELWASFGGNYCLRSAGNWVSSVVDGLLSELAPPSRRVDGGFGTAVWTEAGTTIRLNRSRWRGKDLTWGGAGTIEGNQISQSGVPGGNTVLQVSDAISGNAVILRSVGPSGAANDVSVRASNEGQVSLGNVDQRGANLGFSVTCPTGGNITGRLQAQGAVGSGPAVLAAVGSANDVGIRVAAKGAGSITFGSPAQLPSYTKATMPDAALFPRALASCSDAAGGAAPCYARGSAWINVFTNAVLS